MISLDITSLIKTIISTLLASSVMLVWWQQHRILPILSRKVLFTRWMSFILLRLVPFFFIYIVLNQEPRNDVAFFYNKGLPAMQGKMVYRDFLSFHAPLFSYILALPLFIWNNARTIILMMAAIEFMILNTTYDYACRYANVSPSNALLCYILYYLLPVPFIAILLDSQEEIWFWGAGLLTLGLLTDDKKAETCTFAFRAGLIWGVGMVAIKFMLIVLIIPLFFLIKQRLWFVLGLLTVGIPTIIILYILMGVAFLMPIQHSSYPMAPNLVSVLRPLLNSIFNTANLTDLNWLGLVVTIGYGSWVAWIVRNVGFKKSFIPFFCFLFTLFMLMLPSSTGFYIFIQIVCYIFFIIDNTRKHWALMAILNILLVIQPILMVVYGNNNTYTSLSMLAKPIFLLDYLIQLIEVSLLIWLTLLSYRRLMALKISDRDPVSRLLRG